MQYRTFGRLDFSVSALGFGAMRLPTVQDGKQQKIAEAEATKMIYYAVERGVNYVDTAYPYHDGQSEMLLGKILTGEYRKKVKMATKLPSWKIEITADFDRYFNEQWERLQMEHIDFYLLHALNKNHWSKIRDLGVIEWAEKKIKQGRIGHVGFSFHDKPPVFLEIVDAYDWTFCQVQYNYMDIENQAGTAGVKHAASKGMAVVVMEPILGGRLVDPPQKVQTLWDTAETKRTAADWALQWLWDQPEISVVLSGMSSMRQVEENVASAEQSGVGILTESEVALVDKIRGQYRQLEAIACTACEYCLPCPGGVNIPRNFGAYNMGLIYDKPGHARQAYNNFMPEEQRAKNCTQCQECEEKCPQNIPISQWMPVVHAVLGEEKPYQTSLCA